MRSNIRLLSLNKLLFRINKLIIKNKIAVLIFLCLILFAFGYYYGYIKFTKEGMQTVSANPYLTTLAAHEKERIFPYRYFYGDDTSKILPIVAVTGFYRDDRTRNLFSEYLENGIEIIGVTAYKTFPKPIADSTADNDTLNDKFNYLNKINNWLCCFKDPWNYGFSSENRLIDMSESDFYDVDDTPDVEKKYDFIYICLRDGESDTKCELTGWNAVNRNFKLALECLPIMINEFKLKVLVVGRIGCGLEEKYGDRVEVVDFLPYHEFQQKIKESKYLFIPNIYDASPRVVAESITKGLPVLMNKNIVCGSKYINYETGELFNDEHDIRIALTKLLGKYNNISPKTWWVNNYGKSKCGTILRNFLYESYPSMLENVKEVHFYV